MGITIAVDAMGGDQGLDLVIPAIIQGIQKHKNVTFLLVGDEPAMRKRLGESALALYADQLILSHAEEVVEMDEPPANALRKKKRSSMRLAVNAVKEGRANACVSAGNTGALMATARFVLKMLPGVDRPAIISGFPSNSSHTTYMLDLGANLDSTAQHLHQFAFMASLLVSLLEKKANPRVALLNVGEEEIKGNDVIKETAALLSADPSIHYTGYIEGNQICGDEADVIVCDGLLGNVALKTAEGVAHFIKNQIKSVVHSSWKMKVLAFFCKPLFTQLKEKLDPDKYNGACFLGLKGVVIKSHGGTSVKGFVHACDEAIRQVEADLLSQLTDALEYEKRNVGE